MSGLVGDDATVRIDDHGEAGAVYGRGYFGTLEGGGLHLDRPEAVYLAEMGRLPILDGRGHPVAWEELLRRALRAEPEFPVRYLVYRDLRQRGYVVRESPPPTRFAVLPRGGVLHKTPARFWVEPISERSPFDLAQLLALQERARTARKTLLLGVVDEESDLTYYRITAPSPGGTRPPRAPPAAIPALVAEDRVTVVDGEGVAFLGKGGGFGSAVGTRLELSLLEAAYLAERGDLTLRSAATRRPITRAQLERRAERFDAAFAVRRRAYGWLRDRGLVVKTGFKYGAHFRAYVRDPDQTHARYLIEAAPHDHTAPWPTIAGHVRLAQGVRKEFVLAAVDGAGAVRCVGLERIRP